MQARAHRSDPVLISTPAPSSFTVGKFALPWAEGTERPGERERESEREPEGERERGRLGERGNEREGPGRGTERAREGEGPRVRERGRLGKREREGGSVPVCATECASLSG